MYDIEIEIRPDHVVFSLDGVVIFDQDACIQPGRFGFYSFSQAGVNFMDWTWEILPDLEVPATLCLGAPLSLQALPASCGRAVDQDTHAVASWQWGFGNGNGTLKKNLERMFEQYRDTRFQVATMHCDFSTTNTVQTPDDRYVILDWEDAQDRGLNIDVPFFQFRKQLYKTGEWAIQGAEGFLVVFHYVWFQVIKDNPMMLRDFRIEHGRFVSALSKG